MDVSRDITQRERVKIEDMGTYLRLIQMDYQCDSDDQLASLISEQFNVDSPAPSTSLSTKSSRPTSRANTEWTSRSKN